MGNRLMGLDQLDRSKTHKQGTEHRTSVFDQRTYELLTKILNEIKQMNVKLSEMSDVYTDPEEYK